MPRYFLNVRYKDGPDGLSLDDEGDELPDLETLRAHLLDTAHALISRTHSKLIPDWSQCVFEVTDETGQRVLTLRFAEALE